jgi:arylsulfatase A-like enzyme
LRVPLIIAWPGNGAIAPGKIVGGFTHVVDVAPTLLALAGLPVQNGSFHGRSVERMTGNSLASAMVGEQTPIHADDQPIGYELSGNAALFKGRYKLVENLPPTGDGQWRLYDIVADPGETRDLTTGDPERAKTMRTDYNAFAKRDGVLPMPPGYTADAQINANALRDNAVPQLKRAAPYAALILALLIGGLIWLARGRRRAKAA